MYSNVLAFLLILIGVSWCQSDGLDADEFLTCSLSVRAKVIAPDFGEMCGSALITATLSTTDGIPIANKEIHMTVTTGMLSCLPPDSFGAADLSSADRYCFITDLEGKMEVYVARIPINKPGMVKASVPFGDGLVNASCPYAITKRIVRKKRPDPAVATTTQISP